MFYLSQAEYFKSRFGTRVQKLSIDAGFTCPNRDGKVGVGGCSFCLNEAFNPSYCRRVSSITQQINEGIAFHRHRYRHAPLYLAYFQTYSNTYAPLDVLQQRYGEALSHPDIIGIVIGTRPDCITIPTLEYLASLSKKYYVAIEYGIESCYDHTLSLINRGHTFQQTSDAIHLSAQYGIDVGGHLILGLPDENRQQILNETAIINNLPLTSIKLHQLQILHGTLLHQQCLDSHFFQRLLAPSLDEYISLVCDFLELLRPDLVIERLAGEVPPRFQAFPSMAFRRPDGSLLRNEDIPQLVRHTLAQRGTYQGYRYHKQ